MKTMKMFLTIAATFICLSFNMSSIGENIKVQHDHFIDPRDNHKYKTIKIGEQEWLAENFAYLPKICPGANNCGVWVYNFSGNSISDAKNTTEYKEFGALYSWESAQDLAPEGWHLPTDKEWQELEKKLGIEPNSLEEKVWRGENGQANRLKKNGDTGFNVVFGGWMTDYGKFNFIDEHANFWCATEVDQQRGCERLIGMKNGKIGRDAGNKGCGFSVRYVRNLPAEEAVIVPGSSWENLEKRGDFGWSKAKVDNLHNFVKDSTNATGVNVN